MRKLRRLLVLFTCGTLAFGWAETKGGYISVNLNSFANENFRLDPYQTVGALPTGGTSITVGSTPFTLARFNGQVGSTGVVQTGAFGGVTNAPTSVDIGVNIAGAVEVDTLINSTYGSLNQLSVQIQFIGTGGAFASFDLIQGANIRDYNVGSVFNNAIASGTNTVSFTSSTPTPGGTFATRLDEQIFILPSLFASQTLTTIRLVSTSNSIFTGAPFLAAASVAVPEPSSLVLLVVSGTIGLGTLTRRRAARS